MNCIQVLSENHRRITIELLFGIWANIVSNYSKLNLIRQSDRLPALAGLVNLAGLAIPGRYISGIWEINLADGLFLATCPPTYGTSKKLEGTFLVLDWQDCL